MLPNRGGVRFGVFELDLATDTLRKRGTATRLRGQPLKVLRLLVERPGALVTREDLRLALWDASTFVEFDTGLNAAVRRLRRALGDSAGQPRFIETLPGRGYRFLASVELSTPAEEAVPPLARSTAAGALPLPLPFAPVDAPDHRWRRWTAAGAAVAAVLIGSGGWRFGAHADPGDSAPIRSVAVLPFQNLSADEEGGFFSAGLVDVLLAELGQIRSLKVISRTSTLRYAGTTRSIPEIARELDVDALVEGSVLRTAERVRVTVQLIDGRTDHHRWANSYERPLHDLIALQHDLVNAIVREMGVAVTPDVAVRLAAREPVPPGAYDAYLRGRYFWQQRTEEGLRKAIPYFEDAIRLAPDYAAAHAGLADAHGLLPRYGTVDPRTALVASKAYAERALALDAGIAEAHTALAKALYTLDWNWAEAGAHFERAIAINPSYATAHHWHSLYLMNVGRMDAALGAALEARDVDPVAVPVQAHAAWVRYLAGDVVTAEREARMGMEMAPRHPGTHELLGWIALSQRRFTESIAFFQETMALAPGDPRPLSAVASAYASAGLRDQAVAILRDLEDRRKREPVPPEVFVTIHTALGNLDEAFRWLDQCAGDRSISYFVFDLRYEPLYAPLRADPRLAQLVATMGLDLS